MQEPISLTLLYIMGNQIRINQDNFKIISLKLFYQIQMGKGQLKMAHLFKYKINVIQENIIFDHYMFVKVAYYYIITLFDITLHYIIWN